MNKPCKTCPFTRNSEPGATGGNPPEVYIAQTLMPFLVPCHCHIDYTDPDWQDKTDELPQCVGQAMLRSNLGFDAIMPVKLLRATPDPEAFATLEEFWCHHTGCTPQEAFVHLTLQDNVKEYIRHELTKTGLRKVEP